VGTLLLFSITAPVNIAIMYSVPTALKSQAMAVSTGLSHLIGDFPSPFAVGALIDATNETMAMIFTSLVLVVPAGLWAAAGWVAQKQGDAVARELADCKKAVPTRQPSLECLADERVVKNV
jgi:hypothetical protein